MQMIFNGGGQQGPNKSESLDDGGVAPSPWANLLSVGLKILTAILGGGGGGGDGIDKVDNGSPMQVRTWRLLTALGNSYPIAYNIASVTMLTLHGGTTLGAEYRRI